MFIHTHTKKKNVWGKKFPSKLYTNASTYASRVGPPLLPLGKSKRMEDNEDQSLPVKPAAALAFPYLLSASALTGHKKYITATRSSDNTICSLLAMMTAKQVNG